MRLIDADELLRRYDEEHEGPPGKARKLIEEAPTVCGWISVKDRLPDAAGYNCLVVGKNCFGQKFVFTAFTGYGEPGWWTYDKTRMRRETSEADNRLSPVWEITHWMPLPEPPMEETDAID